jgi:mediator of RNA polymerase II transcription subunit 23
MFSNLLFRYHGKSKALMYDVPKIISTLKGKCGVHHLFWLAESLCMNLILSLKDLFFVKKIIEGNDTTCFSFEV